MTKQATLVAFANSIDFEFTGTLSLVEDASFRASPRGSKWLLQDSEFAQAELPAGIRGAATEESAFARIESYLEADAF